MGIFKYIFLIIFSLLIIEPLLSLKIGKFGIPLLDGYPIILYWIIINFYISNLIIYRLKLIDLRLPFYKFLIFIILTTLLILFTFYCIGNMIIVHKVAFKFIEIPLQEYIQYFISPIVHLFFYLFYRNKKLIITVLNCFLISLFCYIVCFILSKSEIYMLFDLYSTSRIRYFVDIFLIIYSLSKYKEFKLEEQENTTLQALQ